MQKVLIIYSGKGDIDKIAGGIAEGLQKNGHQATVVKAGENDRPVTFHSYDLVIAGSPTLGLYKGKISKKLSSFLKDCKQTAGQDAIAFVTPRLFGTTNALKRVMNELEKLGCIVNNFTHLKNRSQAVNFGKSIKK